MSEIKIVSRWDFSTVLWQGDAESVRDAVLKAYKEGANLRGAYLRDAYLRDAYLRDAYLRGANLGGIKTDFYSILDVTKPEIPGLWKSLHDGQIDGSKYEGECCCLVGTIAKVKQVRYDAIPDLKPNSARPSEKWFMAIRKGDTPDNNPVSEVVRDWIKEYCAEHAISLPVRRVVWETADE